MLTSILLPTMNRPVLLERCIRSLYHNTKNHKIEVVIVIDEDLDSLELVNKLSKEMSEFSWITQWSEKKRGALFGWNEALRLSNGDILCPVGDDGLFYPNWLDYALESHKNKLEGYGLVGLNDLMLDGNVQLATHFIFDRTFCKNVLGGVIAQPVYNYYCIDSEINERAKRVNKFYWESRSIIEHCHSANGKRDLDEHDRDRLNNNFMELDNKLFEERKSQGFPNNFDSII